jgi:hypothetical protein
MLGGRQPGLSPNGTGSDNRSTSGYRRIQGIFSSLPVFFPYSIWWKAGGDFMRVGALAFVSAGTVLLGSAGAEFWDTKDAAAWTHQDSQRIVTHSPWAKEAAMPISQRPGTSYVDVDPAVSPSSPPMAELGNVPATGNGARPMGRTPSLGSAPVGAPEIQPHLRIIWASALPVRLAVLRLREPGTALTADQLAHVDKEWPNYVIAIVGLPAPEAGSNPKSLAGSAFLSVRGKPPLAAVDSDYRHIGDDDVYFFRFPKSAMPLTTADGDVTFKVTAGTMNLKQRFELSSMKFHGQLAL